MGVGSGLYMYDVVVKRSRSLSHLLMSSCTYHLVPIVLNVITTSRPFIPFLLFSAHYSSTLL